MDSVSPAGGVDRAGGLQPLDKVDHAQLRMAPACFAGRPFVQVVPDEFAAAAAQHPLLFNKRADTGRFYVGALFGFTDEENLFLSDVGDFTGYRPLDCEREGFFVADVGGAAAIVIDPASPRFRAPDGERLFDERGEADSALLRVRRALDRMNTGLADCERFIDTMLALALIEPIDIDLRFDDGERLSLAGLYTVSLDALGRLDDAKVIDLFRRGYLQLAHVMNASLRQIPIMARARNRRLATV